MFGKKRNKSIEVSKLSSLIADNLHIVGDVLFSGGLRVDGRIEGNVLGKPGEKSLIVLSEKGCIVGRVHAHDAVINGTVSGDLEVEHFLELQAGAKVSGNIAYRQLQMECGASVEGQLVRTGDVAARETADAAEGTDGRDVRKAAAGEALAQPEGGARRGGEVQTAVLRQGVRHAAADPATARQPASEAANAVRPGAGSAAASAIGTKSSAAAN
ncbi:MAG TPA: polymer-forming cytoskeletal protein [Rhodocyclaceae bacterium]|nr:polymer-forming cytoskeletal protein [Rhodocyclaceae bacterium]